jgi:predicted nucleic acid-binding protein
MVDALFRAGHVLCVSPAIIAEFADVLQREFERSKEEVRDTLRDVSPLLSPVTPHEVVSIVHADPSDDRIIEAAIAASADFIVTYDKHLLSLNTFRNIRIVTPEQILRHL